ncbi:hypothetical protein [Brucella anthropi]|uniref:hypothetical protein n=1 Tax=Brucella anthropi TaxID=529 RepID=UPI001CFDF7BE|nr:hypothetical protein [Brucella anthropi]
MTDEPNSKNLVLGLISTSGQRPSVREKSPPSPAPESAGEDQAPPTSSKPPLARNQFRDMVARGESRDPIAGKRFRDTEKVTTGIYIRADIHKKLKILAAIERRKFNSYIEEAIDDYLEKIADRIPDIS